MESIRQKAKSKKQKRVNGRYAVFLSWVWVVVLLLVVTPLFLFQLWGMNAQDGLQQAKRSLLLNPDDTGMKIKLAEMALDAGDLDRFDLIANSIPLTNNLAERGVPELTVGVLGVSTGKLDNLLRRRELTSVDGVNKMVEKWQLILKNYNGYRDVYLQLAALYLRIKDRVTAKEYLEAAYELDPNSEKVALVRKLIEGGGIVR